MVRGDDGVEVDSPSLSTSVQVLWTAVHSL